MRYLSAIAMLGALAVFTAPAAARAVTDCPMRDAPFSVDSALIDLLLSPAAKAMVDRVAPGRLESLPPRFGGTTPPTFTAILTLRNSASLTGLQPDAMPIMDRDLRTIPVTTADKVARCRRYDNDVPDFTLPTGKPHLLLFEKINGFRDEPSVAAAHQAFLAMAERKGWAIVATDRAGVFNPATLRQFDAVVWNNISGDVLTLAQRRALKGYLEGGGAFVGVHGTAGDPVYFWDWYADKLIGARFSGHPHAPQFQDARVVVNATHPLASGLPGEWVMNDEWYSFKTNPRSIGAQVVATLDETSYAPKGPDYDLRMGDHPIAWTNCIGRGRMFYSAIGHRPETYSDPNYLALLEAAIDWAAVSGKTACAPAR